MERVEYHRHSRARMAETAKDVSRHATPMRVNVRNKVWPPRDALPRDPAWHAYKREQTPYPLYTRERSWEKPKTSFETCHAGSRRSASLPCHTSRKRVETRLRSSHQPLATSH